MENNTPISTKNIIVVEPDGQERANEAALLVQHGWTVRHTNNSYEAIQWLKIDNSAALLIIAENATPLNGYQAVDYIRRELNSEIPIIIGLTTHNEVQNYESRTEYFLKPFDSTHVDAIRKIIDANTDTDTDTETVYSLNYLNMLAEGNKDFITDCLKVFKTSVTVKLTQLFEALQQKDYQGIGEIAHNIKPSFEMLESNLSAEICNSLTYNASETEFPELIARLNKEFHKIIHQLEKDFPGLE